ncbi:MAG: acyl-CoA dehydrogenase, partial [Gordonia amarae]
MLLELDSDQRFWRETVRDALAKECPASLVRAVAEDGADTTGLWQTYVDMGWTELTDRSETVELGLLIEALGAATDPTPFLATLTQFNPLAGNRVDTKLSGAAVYD